MVGLENNFRDWVRGRWVGWVDGREPRGRGSRAGWGSGTGAPDLTLGVKLQVVKGTWQQDINILLPVELKRARFTHGTKLVSESSVNADQIKWHGAAASKGVLTAFLWGVESSDVKHGWTAYIMKPNTGWATEEEYTRLPGEENAFFQAISTWVRQQILP